MAGIKQRWSATWRGVGTFLKDTYRSDTVTRPSHWVHLWMALDREPGRIVRLEMSPNQARYVARLLVKYADRADERSKERPAG